MKELFPQYYQLSDRQLSKLFKNCIFIFDTNVLLNLYRYSASTRKDLLKILKKLSSQNRIWLPFQIALEFQQNRLSVISDQKIKFGEVKKVITNIQDEFKTQLDKLNLRKRHSAINPDELLEKISSAFDDYSKTLEKFEEKQSDVYEDDELRNEIDSIFENKIGEPFSQAELDQIFEEGKKRYSQNRPPGYADESEKKGTYYFYKNLQIKREFGDLIYWKEIIRYATENKIEGLILVTDDNKEDWWLRVSGKTIGPRQELVSEILEIPELKEFHMYNSEKFMEFAKKYLKISINEDSITQVKEISKLSSRGIGSVHIRRFLTQLYEGKCQICGIPDIGQLAHIIPIRQGGEDGMENTLLLCPNHHTLFDKGSFSIDENLNLIDSEDNVFGKLRLDSRHLINWENFKWFNEKLNNN